MTFTRPPGKYQRGSYSKLRSLARSVRFLSPGESLSRDSDASILALRVLPGSHRDGPVRRDPDDPTRFLTDPTALAVDTARTLEVPAGTVVWFGAFLVHCSSPNTSAQHRRALLPSWQPAGRARLQTFPYDFTRVEELP